MLTSAADQTVSSVGGDGLLFWVETSCIQQPTFPLRGARCRRHMSRGSLPFRLHAGCVQPRLTGGPALQRASFRAITENVTASSASLLRANVEEGEGKHPGKGDLCGLPTAAPQLWGLGGRCHLLPFGMTQLQEHRAHYCP